MTFTEWCQIEAMLGANWPQLRELSDNDYRLRHGFAADLDADDAKAAVVMLARSGREHPPKPGEIVAAVRNAKRGAVPEPGVVLDLLCQAASRFGRDDELGALRWLSGQSPHAARFAREHGWREFCGERLFDPEVAGAVRQRVERSIQSSTAGLEREVREGRVLPLVRDRIRDLERGTSGRLGLHQPDVVAVLDAGDDAPIVDGVVEETR
jgi:hypothetical protein